MVDRDIFDEVAEENDIFSQTQSTEESTIETLKSEISSLIEKNFSLSMKERKTEKEKMAAQVEALVKSEISKIKPVQNIIERQIEQIIKHEKTVKHVQVPINLPLPIIQPQKVREIIKEVRVEAKNLDQYAEKKLIDELKKQISDLKQLFNESTRKTEFLMSMRGGSGVIGIPIPEGNPDNYILTVIKGKAVWRPNAGGSAVTPFSIASFSDSQSSSILIGTGIWKSAGGLSFVASYTNGPATSGVVSSSGYSDLILSNSFQGPTSTVQDINYPSVGGSIVFNLAASGDNGADNVSISHLFANNRYWGPLAKQSGFIASDVTGLSGNDISNSIAKSFSMTAGPGEYLVWASPVRLGTVVFFVGGFQGGFNDPETVSITNANGFTEDYYVYSSVNSNLGAVNVVTQ